MIHLKPPVPAVISIQPALPVELRSNWPCLWRCVWGPVGLPPRTLGRIPPPLSSNLILSEGWTARQRPCPRPPWGGPAFTTLHVRPLRQVLCPFPLHGKTYLALFTYLLLRSI